MKEEGRGKWEEGRRKKKEKKRKDEKGRRRKMEQGVGGTKFGREATIETSPGAKIGEGPNLKNNLHE